MVALLTGSPAAAWSGMGHRVSGMIAERYLDSRARAGVKAILGVESAAEASTWADFMRSDPSEFWQKTASPWHYVTVPDGKTYAEVGAPPEGDSVTALQRFSATVRDRNAPLADRQLALRFIIHIVGDLHQPLHVGNGRDRGGNDVRVEFFRKPTNLHAVWDDDLVENEGLSFSEKAKWLSEKITPAQAKAWQTADPLVWIAESQALRDATYPPPMPNAAPGTVPNLRFDYVFQHQGTVNLRLSQAGVRIAAYLNQLFAR
ncbi:S1/P1 nuclease [Sandaracinobacteroides saxicola]|nr:S1/P1 nuclease [Sandaracinobacteroides saxicola]